MPPPEARMRHRSSKYVSTARPSLEVRSVMALHWSWKEVRRRIVPAGAGVCKIARMSLPVPLVRAVALPIPLLSIRFQLRPFARHSCAWGTAGGPRRRFRTAIGWESLACYISGTCQAAWPSVSVPQRSAAGTPCAPGSCSWPVRTPGVLPSRFLGPWPWWQEVSSRHLWVSAWEVSSWRVWSAWFLRVACRVSGSCAGVKFF